MPLPGPQAQVATKPPRQSRFREDFDAPPMPPALTDADLAKQETTAVARAASAAARQKKRKARLARSRSLHLAAAAVPSRARSFLARAPPADLTACLRWTQRPALGRSASLFKPRRPASLAAGGDLRPVYWNPERNRRPGEGTGHRAQQPSVGSTTSRFSFSSGEGDDVPVDGAWGVAAGMDEGEGKARKSVAARAREVLVRRWREVRRWRRGGNGEQGGGKEGGSAGLGGHVGAGGTASIGDTSTTASTGPKPGEAAPSKRGGGRRKKVGPGAQVVGGDGFLRLPGKLDHIAERAPGMPKRSGTVRSDSAVDLLPERNRRRSVSLSPPDETTTHPAAGTAGGGRGEGVVQEAWWVHNASGLYMR